MQSPRGNEEKCSDQENDTTLKDSCKGKNHKLSDLSDSFSFSYEVNLLIVAN